jgi:hypothetical protein
MRRIALGALCMVVLGAGSSARADEPKPAVALQCDRATEPGRVRCSVEAKVGAGEAIRWGDVEILETPDFAQPLKGRVGPKEASTREDAAWRWGFALLARRAGTGALKARVRVVVCVEKSGCTPHTVEAQTTLRVG